MIGRLNHIGIAVPSIEAAKRSYQTLYGVAEAQMTPTRDLPAQGVRFAFIDLENSQLELIEPLGDASPLVKFLERNPKGGQHHVCFEVSDIHATKEALAAKGATILGEPRIGAHGVPVIFVHPKDTDGVLIELMQSPGAH
jgi:methylmalonyl-CoA/ethylmalonyl-CoA epimerase